MNITIYLLGICIVLGVVALYFEHRSRQSRKPQAFQVKLGVWDMLRRCSYKIRITDYPQLCGKELNVGVITILDDNQMPVMFADLTGCNTFSDISCNISNEYLVLKRFSRGMFCSELFSKTEHGRGTVVIMMTNRKEGNNV